MKTGSFAEDGQMMSPRDEMGVGLQNSQRMQKTDYGRGFLGGNITAGQLDENETGQEA